MREVGQSYGQDLMSLYLTPILVYLHIIYKVQRFCMWVFVGERSLGICGCGGFGGKELGESGVYGGCIHTLGKT